MLALVRFNLFVRPRSPFAQTIRRSTGEGRSDTVVEVWARSVQCVARGVRSKFFFSPGVGKTSLPFFMRRWFVPGILHFSKCIVFSIQYVSSKTARLATTLGSLRRYGVHYHPSLGALRAACRVSRARVPCVTRACSVSSAILFLGKHKSDRRSQ